MSPSCRGFGPTDPPADSAESPSLKESLRGEAAGLGFQIFGVAPAKRLEEDVKRLRESLARGDMAKMAAYLGDRPEKRGDPGALLGGARSVLVVGMSYAQSPPDLSTISGQPEGQIARYALGRDYHQVIAPRLERMAVWLAGETAGVAECRTFVDTGPLLERAFARQAGLGFIGKNNCLIHPVYGSWFLLGALATTLELPPDGPIGSQCGDCRLCLDACPTGALYEPHRVDARRCLSYATVETRDALAPEIAQRLADRLFGCDACQEVCPFNRAPLECQEPALRPGSPQEEPSAIGKIDGSNATLERLLAIRSNRDFARALEESAMKRPRRKGLLRNALIVAANLRRNDLHETLRSMASNERETPLVRRYAQEALRAASPGMDP
ncbi:MAG TPA: tRNA epoxyqueuosine(34) reductase QueG [Sumerlaeia bacterium]|nr:tRNA epoxyqueuosine(34) reductase QueG [Sumerlaeia bacterium]